MLGQSISRNAVILGFFAVVSTAIIAGTFLGTQSSIADNIRKAEEKALLEIIPASAHDNAMLDDAIPVDDSELLGLRVAKKLYLARRQGETIGVILPVTARDGYTGDIELIVGVWRDGRVAGVRVLSHRETPGLGDAVDYRKSHWVDGFNGKRLGDPVAARWAVKKDGGAFDQFTGATITPRAVTRAVKNALIYFDQNQSQWLGEKRRQPVPQAAAQAQADEEDSHHG